MLSFLDTKAFASQSEVITEQQLQIEELQERFFDELSHLRGLKEIVFGQDGSLGSRRRRGCSDSLSMALSSIK